MLDTIKATSSLRRVHARSLREPLQRPSPFLLKSPRFRHHESCLCTGGIWSDKIYERTGNVQRARLTVIVGGMTGALIFLTPVLFVRDLTTVCFCLCAAFFLMELVIAPLWSVPMDIAPNYAGTASSFMNVGFGLAGITSPLVFGWVIDRTGNWQLPFAISMGLLVLGIILSFFMRPDRAFRPAGYQKDPAPVANEQRA